MAERTCEIWWATLDRLRPRHSALLDPQERSRAERLARPADRDRALLSAAMVRLVGARALDLGLADPDGARRLDVCRRCVVCGGPHGKPSVGSGVHLSVSHAGGLVLVAVTRVAPVGVDVEPTTRSAQARAAAPGACTPDETAAITDGRDALRYWTRKEAIVKATGEGLTVPLTDLRVSAPDAPARLLDWDPADGYLGALAVLTTAPLDVVVRPADDLLAA